MNEPKNHKQAQQPKPCAGCPQEHACRNVWAAENKGPLTATGMVLASLAAFALPLAAAATGAVAGATIGGQDSWHTAAGTLAGLAAGVALGVALVRIIRKRLHV